MLRSCSGSHRAAIVKLPWLNLDTLGAGPCRGVSRRRDMGDRVRPTVSACAQAGFIHSMLCLGDFEDYPCSQHAVPRHSHAPIFHPAWPAFSFPILRVGYWALPSLHPVEFAKKRHICTWMSDGGKALAFCRNGAAHSKAFLASIEKAKAFLVFRISHRHDE